MARDRCTRSGLGRASACRFVSGSDLFTSRSDPAVLRRHQDVLERDGGTDRCRLVREQWRVRHGQLARSLTLDPDLFLFDEPFGALDEITRWRLNDELIELFAARRFGALFITHSVSEAVYLSSRMVVMSGRPGRIVESFDIPFPMPRDPDIRFTAEFAALSGEVSPALRAGHS